MVLRFWGAGELTAQKEAMCTAWLLPFVIFGLGNPKNLNLWGVSPDTVLSTKLI